MFQDSQLILGTHLEDVARRMEGYSKSGGVLNFRCPICGDSKKNLSKKRAYIYTRENKWFFHCHNTCGCYSGSRWLKENFPEDYRRYVEDVIRGDFKIGDAPPPPPPSPRRTQVDSFSPINSDSDLAKEALSYCKKRRIFPEVYNKFMVAENGIYRNRLIIPFYKKDGSYPFFQGRLLRGEGVKYLSKLGKKMMYGEDWLDRGLPHIVVEGPIDATFISNSVGLVGVGVDSFDRNRNTHFWLDYDETGLDKAKELLKVGASVFNWKKFLASNRISVDGGKMDINDLVIKMDLRNKIIYDDFKEYFTSDFYDQFNF